MNNKRIETLKNNGVDTNKFFTLMVNEDIKAGTKINISVEGNEEVAQKIIEDGYVKNTRLHRRFVMAHYFKMLESKEGWHKYLTDKYSYMYQFDMMFEEVRVLGKIQKKDWQTFSERSKFFTKDVVINVLTDYLDDLDNYIKTLRIKKCKGEDYVSIPGYGNVFTDEVQEVVVAPIKAIVGIINRSYNYENMYNSMMVLKRIMVKLPYETKKSKTWVDAFQREGAFYTLKNLIMFHDVKFYADGYMYSSAESSMQALNKVAKFDGYILHAMLKATIKKNNFDFRKSIEAHK